MQKKKKGKETYRKGEDTWSWLISDYLEKLAGEAPTSVLESNNLLYLLLGMMLAMIIVSGILSESTLRKLEVNRRLPERIFSGQPTLVDHRRGLRMLTLRVIER